MDTGIPQNLDDQLKRWAGNREVKSGFRQGFNEKLNELSVEAATFGFARLAPHGKIRRLCRRAGDVYPEGVKVSTSTPRTLSYRALKKELKGTGEQTHHLNQNAVYKDIIPESEGLAVGLRENAFTDIGTPHYEAHKSLEAFWDPYRRGGTKFGKTPTNAEYGQAVENSLRAAGLSQTEAARVANQAAEQRNAYPLLAPKPSSS